MMTRTVLECVSNLSNGYREYLCKMCERAFLCFKEHKPKFCAFCGRGAGRKVG